MHQRGNQWVLTLTMTAAIELEEKLKQEGKCLGDIDSVWRRKAQLVERYHRGKN